MFLWYSAVSAHPLHKFSAPLLTYICAKARANCSEHSMSLACCFPAQTKPIGDHAIRSKVWRAEHFVLRAGSAGLFGTNRQERFAAIRPHDVLRPISARLRSHSLRKHLGRSAGRPLS